MQSLMLFFNVEAHLLFNKPYITFYVNTSKEVCIYCVSAREDSRIPITAQPWHTQKRLLWDRWKTEHNYKMKITTNTMSTS